MTELKDMQGRALAVGDRVAFVGYRNANSLTVGVVRRLQKVRAQVEYQGLWSEDPVLEIINTRALVKV